jgi:hypothetical protein
MITLAAITLLASFSGLFFMVRPSRPVAMLVPVRRVSLGASWTVADDTF